ncbi:MAG: hypothetical protein JKY11_00835 [Alphaproteobacteria bacterium]|nr:hypothetical protein [Alphaproteobacteria bacterium]
MYRILIFMAVLFLPVSVNATCPVISPTLNFKLNMIPVKYDHSLDKAEIRVKSNASGLVSGHLQGQVNVRFVPKTRKSADEKCILFSTSDVVISNTPVLRIAANYPKGSCEYNVVKAHEEKHLRLMNLFFENLEQDYKAYLQKEFVGKGAVSIGKKDQLRAELLHIAKNFIHVINRDQKRLHDRDIDHPDKTAIERAQCSNW